MRYFFIFIFLGCIYSEMDAQTNPCFDERLQSGISAFNEKGYNKAVKRWEAALNNCELNYEEKRKLNDYISRAKNAMNNNTLKTTHFSDEPEMVFVAGGTFQMGSNFSLAAKSHNHLLSFIASGTYKEESISVEINEQPVHSVTLSSYYIGKYEVTQAQWQAIMGNNPSNFVGDDLPVESVSWDDIQSFLQKLNSKTKKQYRLPTIAEWEFAARGGNSSNNYTYSGSNNINDVAWYTENSSYKTHIRGGKQANELGIYDMTGNVWEWCSDWYETYSASPVQNPTGPTEGFVREYRGGSWVFNPDYCRVAFRGSHAPAFRNGDLGFRVAIASQ